MRLQIWRVEDVENILWATQTVSQASTTVSTGSRPIAYHQGFQQGFGTTLCHVANSFNGKPSLSEVWSRDQILNTLLTTQTAMQAKTTTASDQSETTGHQQGFEQGFDVALWCTATAFGVSLLSAGIDSLPNQTPQVPSDPDPWFQDDIQNILLAMRLVMQETIDASAQLARPVAYYDGFEAALRQVAKSFGIKLLSTGVSVSQKYTHFWPRQDLASRLHLLHRTIPTITATAKPELVIYWQGFRVALNGIATAFGLRSFH